MVNLFEQELMPSGYYVIYVCIAENRFLIPTRRGGGKINELMRKLIKISLLFLSVNYTLSMCSSAKDSGNTLKADMNKTYQYVELSRDLVLAAKNNTPYADIQKTLAEAPVASLAAELSNDEAKKAFWINIYNAYVQLILSEKPELFEDRGAFFGEDRVTIAGQALSFDDIEHGIIRGSKVKWLLGLIKDPFASEYEKTFRVDKTDGRIHFALNCGAASCPEVAVYEAKVMDQQLEIATRQYLQKTSTYQSEEEKVAVTSLFSWFRGDFGGKNGIRNFLKKHNIIPQDSKPELEFKDYDWTLDLGNFKEIVVADAE